MSFALNTRFAVRKEAWTGQCLCCQFFSGQQIWTQERCYIIHSRSLENRNQNVCVYNAHLNVGEEVFKFTLLSFSPACGVTIYPYASYFPGWKGRRGPNRSHVWTLSGCRWYLGSWWRGFFLFPRAQTRNLSSWDGHVIADWCLYVGILTFLAQTKKNHWIEWKQLK